MRLSRHGEIARLSNQAYDRPPASMPHSLLTSADSCPPRSSSYVHPPQHAVPLHTDASQRALRAGSDKPRRSQRATAVRRSNARTGPIARTAVRGGCIRALHCTAPCTFSPFPRVAGGEMVAGAEGLTSVDWLHDTTRWRAQSPSRREGGRDGGCGCEFEGAWTVETTATIDALSRSP